MAQGQRYRLSCRFYPLKPPLRYPGHEVRQILDRWDQSNVHGQSILFYQQLYRFQLSAEQYFAGGLHAYSSLSGERVHMLTGSVFKCMNLHFHCYARIDALQCCIKFGQVNVPECRSRVAANTHLQRQHHPGGR